MQTILKPQKKLSAKIKLLVASFDFEIERRKIPAFRASVIEKVGRENILFHNHLKQQQFLYGYPLIQYKTIRRKPTMVCINQGSEEILKFFEQVNWDLVIYEKRIKTDIKHISFDYFHCGFSTKPITYKIYNWFALNETNFGKFIALNSNREKVEFLQRILIGNILAFAKGIQWNVAEQIEIRITKLPKSRYFSFKNHQMMGFNLEFITNMILPDFIGLGKSVSRGFGMIRRSESTWIK